MTIFNNTVGGIYTYYDDKKPKAYTFPKGATIGLNGINISLENITVNVHDVGYDSSSIQAFINSIHAISSSSPNVINSPIFIDDNNIANGFPLRRDFNRFNIPYVDFAHYDALGKRVHGQSIGSSDPDVLQFMHLSKQFELIHQEHRSRYKEEITKQLNRLKCYPKSLSLIYDDRKLKHSTHIILTYTSAKECTLQIDSTAPLLLNFMSPQNLCNLLENHGLNRDTYAERINPIKPNFIDIYQKSGDKYPVCSVELVAPVNKLLIEKAYQRMIKMLSLLDIPINKIILNHSHYNNKDTLHCVPFAIQNKIEFILNNKGYSNESAYEKGLRLRAEQALLCYLLGGYEIIPRHDPITAAGCFLSYDSEKWYSNFEEVRHALKQNIAKLSYQEIERLYLSTEINDTVEIAFVVKQFIKEILITKAENEEFIKLPVSNELHKAAIALAHNHAPTVLYSESTATLFMSPKLKIYDNKTTADDVQKLTP